MEKSELVDDEIRMRAGMESQWAIAYAILRLADEVQDLVTAKVWGKLERPE